MVFKTYSIFKLAQAIVISQASPNFFPDLFKTRICSWFLMFLDFVHVSCKNLFMHSRAVAKFVHVASFPAWALVLNTKRINYSRLNFIQFLFNCSISTFRSTEGPFKISYPCSICSVVFHWRLFDLFSSIPLAIVRFVH